MAPKDLSELIRKHLESDKDNSCDQISDIEDINDMFDYEDEHPQGPTDKSKMSCGQNNGYNELEHFYKNNLNTLKSKYKLNKKQILQIMCECCQEISHYHRTHEAFEKCVYDKAKNG
jgi:hypothetical protein